MNKLQFRDKILNGIPLSINDFHQQEIWRIESQIKEKIRNNTHALMAIFPAEGVKALQLFQSENTWETIDGVIKLGCMGVKYNEATEFMKENPNFKDFQHFLPTPKDGLKGELKKLQTK